MHLTLVGLEQMSCFVLKVEQKGKGNSPFDGEKLGKACDVTNAVSNTMLQLLIKRELYLG
jgi:hypothetical protein